MYKLIIADDELIIRQRLLLAIDWNALGFEVIADVEDGKTLYDKTVELMPDAVLIDIKMPVMSGIEYAKKIREINKSVKIVALSGYSDSEYLMEMINLGIFSYMLKPLKEDDLNNTFTRLAKELDKEASLNLLKQRDAISRYLMDDNYNMFLNSFESTHKYFTFFKLYFDEIPLALISEVTKNILNCTGILFDTYYVISQTNQDILFCVPFDSNENFDTEMQESFICLNDSISSLSDKVSLSMCYVPCTDDWQSLRKLIQNFSIYEKSRFIYGRNSLIDASRLINSEFSDNIVFFDNIEKNIVQKLEKHDIASITADLKNFSNTLIKENKSVAGFKQSYFYLINSVYHSLSENNLANDRIKQICSDVFEHLEEISFSDSLYEYTCNMLEEISETLNSDNMNHYIDFHYEQAIDFIDKNFMYDISLSQLASVLGLSYGYLSSIFTQKNKLGFVKQLRDRRMTEAKQLLCNTNKKINEISKDVGFTNERYFSSVFRQETGLSPMKYRLKYSKE